jgi:hypothetical protein
MALAQLYARVRVVATDSAARGLRILHPVRRMTATAALAEFAPDVVLVSWMELGQDWTREVRATASVAEYLLIGEADAGSCGHAWLTWGHSFEAIAATERSDAAQPAQTPPYAADGFERVDLPVRHPTAGRTQV